MEWIDPDTGEIYDVTYNVTQTQDEGPEHFLWRRADVYPVEWHKLPPFVCHDDMRKFEDHFFGPTKGWQHGIPGSIVSDIEVLDKATDTIVGKVDDGESYAKLYKSEVEQILDAIADARSGLLYLAAQLKTQG